MDGAPEQLFIWIARWEDFQHYRPERDRPPAWIKSYTKQLDDDRYLTLSNRQRALLADLRHMFATMRARVPHDRIRIEARRQAETRHADLVALNEAGLIELVSRATLEERLERLYSDSRPPRARPRAREEEEVEVEDPLTPATDAGEPDERTPDPALGPGEVACAMCGHPVRIGYRCPSCNSSPRTAGSDSRQAARKARAGSGTSANAAARAETFTRNAGWQYDLKTFHDELTDRFKGTLAQPVLDELDRLHAQLNANTNGDTPEDDDDDW